jgi:hypothetical protein
VTSLPENQIENENTSEKKDKQLKRPEKSNKEIVRGK